MPILELNAGRSVFREILRAISDTLFRRARTKANPLPPAKEPAVVSGNPKFESNSGATTRRRLCEEVDELERLDAEREERGDSGFGKAAEDRIVWGELIELELQEIDAQVDRIRGAAGREPSATARSNPHKGDSHERNHS